MLTFQQRASIIGDTSQWTITEVERIEDMLQAAYDLGLEKAAQMEDARHFRGWKGFGVVPPSPFAQALRAAAKDVKHG